MKVFDFIKGKIELNNPPKKRLLLKQASLLCVTVFMLITVVFAWFTANLGTATASGLSVSMEAGDSLEFCLNKGAIDEDGKSIESWHTSINLLSAKDSTIISSTNSLFDSNGNLRLNMEDITSDGRTFLRPVFYPENDENGQRVPNVEKDWSYATQNESYITQTIYFRTSKKSDIFMGPGTGIITSCENEGKMLVSDNAEDIGNKHPDYNFSNDCIVGALRISAVNKDGDICFVCIPRYDVELKRGTDSEGKKTINMLSGGNVTENSSKHNYYSTNYQEDKGPIEYTNTNLIFGFDGTQKIATTTKVSDGVYEAKATINVWIEGCDSETTRILSGGKFQLAFDFLAIENNEPDTTAPTEAEVVE